jgi:glycosidase
LLLTLPGSPYLYYGEEIGMLGMKPDFFIREPMLWRREPDPERTRPQRVRHSTDSTVRPVADQDEDPASLLNHYRDLIALRNATPALSVGSLETVDGLDERLVAFVRRHADGDVLVLHNLGREEAGFALPDGLRAFGKVRWASSEGVQFREGLVNLPPCGSLVLE